MNMSIKLLQAGAFGTGLLLMASPALAANSTSAGALRVERPTLKSVGFDWRITGDESQRQGGGRLSQEG